VEEGEDLDGVRVLLGECEDYGDKRMYARYGRNVVRGELASSGSRSAKEECAGHGSLTVEIVVADVHVVDAGISEAWCDGLPFLLLL
jgi:hypothetical protein